MHTLTRLGSPLLRTGLFVCLLAKTAYAANGDGDLFPQALLLRGESKAVDDNSYVPAGFDADSLARILKGRLACGVQNVSTSRPDELGKLLTKWTNENRNTASAEAAKDVRNCRIVYYRGKVSLDSGKSLVLRLDDSLRPDDSRSNFPIASLLQSLSRVAEKHPVLLVLDTTSGLDEKGLKQSFASALRNVPQQLGVIVVGQDRMLWKNRSLANYWLCHGLTGRADANGDGRVTFLEITDFVFWRFGASGVVVAHVGDALKPQTAATVQPSTLDELLEDLAEGLALQFHEEGIQLVALPELEFSGALPENNDLPRRPYGALTRYCLARLKRELDLRSWFRFRVVDGGNLRTCLNDNKVGPDNIQSPSLYKVGENIRMSATNVSDAPVAVVLGTIVQRSAEEIAMSLTSWDTASGAAAATIVGQARINASEWAMLGKSAVNKPALIRFVSAPQVAPSASVDSPQKNKKNPASPSQPSSDPRKSNSGGKKVDAIQTTSSKENRSTQPILQFDTDHAEELRRSEVKQFEESSLRKHPSLDPGLGFPFRVNVAVEQSDRTGMNQYVDLPQKPSADGRDVYVELAPGQNYIIRVENSGSKPVFMRLLVDGLNTLPDVPLTRQKEQYEVAPQVEEKISLPAQIVSLNTARPWYFEPRLKCEVRGFFTSVPDGSKEVLATLQKFEVTDAATSEAARKKYLKDVGIITAAFYAPGPRPLSMGAGERVFGTKLGAEKNEKVQRYEGSEFPRELLGVVHIRYGVKPLPN